MTILYKIRYILPAKGGLRHGNHVAGFWSNDDCEIISMSVVSPDLFGLGLIQWIYEGVKSAWLAVKVFAVGESNLFSPL